MALSGEVALERCCGPGAKLTAKLELLRRATK